MKPRIVPEIFSRIILSTNTRIVVLLLAVSLLLGSCGFHLRGTGLSSNIESVGITAQRQVSIDDELRRNLGYAGVEVSKDAELVVSLLGERSLRRSVSVTEQARTAEYELTMEVQYQISKGSGHSGTGEKMLLPPRWIQSQRNYRFDRFNIIGSSEEQALLEKDMRNDLAQQIIRSLDAVSRAAETN